MSRKKKSKRTEAVNKPPPQPTEPTTRRGVLITPLTGEERGLTLFSVPADVFATLTTLKIPLEIFDSQPWVDCRATHSLGLPLRATRWPSDNARVPNNFPLGLFLNPDPEDDTFGTIRFRRLDGAVLVASAVDNGEVKEKEVEMALTYLGGLSGEMTAFVREEREKVKAAEGEERRNEDQAEKVERARELAGKTLTQDAFRRYVKGCVGKKV
ncbi:hypothetical protein B0A55_06601 [Friedmanniomyces simplex]|uniref:Uncharacterized protein n=1 Tax=Friedmanniomyces simplex TaxID=329884 RepID=A0A4U0XJ59_9PEZI|nr:hypothetical protein B0A55_06601 [Friedmanniomyces simplex]